MSCYEWEEGTLKLSCAEYPKFRRKLIEAYNTIQDQRLEAAVRVYQEMVTSKVNIAIAFSKLQIDDHGIYRSIMVDMVPVPEADLKARYISPPDEWKKHVNDTIWKERKSPRMPHRKDFPHALLSATCFDTGEASIRLDHENRTVRWSVPENNHACERARNSELGKVFFRLLNQVVWTRGTGGEIVGNDEYNRDNRGSGGGSNYTTASYPMKERSGLFAQFQR